MEMNISKPPIREALVDIRFNFGNNKPDYRVFEKLHDQIKADFPKKQVLKWGQFSLDMKADNKNPVIETSSGENGYRFDSADGTRIVQFRTDGFTYSKLKPYTGWEDFSSEAKKLFELYVGATSPVSVNRIALRYINLIEIPEKSFELEKYFTMSPIIPKGLPDSIIGYINRIVLKDDASNAIGILTQNIDPKQTVTNGSAPFIFDIDVFIENVTLDYKDTNFWDNFNPLRDLKNKMFNLGLTDITKKLFE